VRGAHLAGLCCVAAGWFVQQFEFHVHEVGTEEPSVMFVVTRDADSARVLAERTRRQTRHCTHVDVWQGNRRLFCVGRASSHGGTRCGGAAPPT
jgi:hypothetical protein